jgi:hypothetical protein
MLLPIELVYHVCCSFILINLHPKHVSNVYKVVLHVLWLDVAQGHARSIPAGSHGISSRIAFLEVAKDGLKWKVSTVSVRVFFCVVDVLRV